MSETLQEIGAKHAAARYAEMAATAAGAQAKVDALTKALADSEYYRMVAESQLASVTLPDGMEMLYHAGGAEPHKEVYGLIDIHSGQAYRREFLGEESIWVPAERNGTAVSYTWPLGDGMGPFLALQDDWYLRKIVTELENADAHNHLLRRQFSGKSGYTAGPGAGQDASPAHGAVRVLNDLEESHRETQARLSASETRNERLEHALQEANQQLAELRQEKAS